jgi:hypothetical protein
MGAGDGVSSPTLEPTAVASPAAPQSTSLQPIQSAAQLAVAAVPETHALQPAQPPKIMPIPPVNTEIVPLPAQPTYPLKPEVTAMVETIVAPLGEFDQLGLQSGAPFANVAQGVVPLGDVYIKQAPRQRRAAATAAAKNLQNIIAEEGLPNEVMCPRSLNWLIMSFVHHIHCMYLLRLLKRNVWQVR